MKRKYNSRHVAKALINKLYLESEMFIASGQHNIKIMQRFDEVLNLIKEKGYENKNRSRKESRTI